MAPRRDPAAFAAWRSAEAERVKNQYLAPNAAFEAEIHKLLSRDHPRRRPVTVGMLQNLDLDRALGVFQTRFANAADFTFIFVGDLDLERMRPLVSTYLASLPASAEREVPRDLGIRPPNGVQTLTVRRGREPKSEVKIIFFGSVPWSRSAENDLRALAEVLELRLHGVLRENLSGVYQVRVIPNFSRSRYPSYRLTIEFGAAPERVAELEHAVFAEIEEIQAHGVGPDYITKVKAARQRQRETDLLRNEYWLVQLEQAYLHGDDPLVLQDASLLTQVSSDSVRAAARLFASQAQYLLAELMPELSPAAAP